MTKAEQLIEQLIEAGIGLSGLAPAVVAKAKQMGGVFAGNSGPRHADWDFEFPSPSVARAFVRELPSFWSQGTSSGVTATVNNARWR